MKELGIVAKGPGWEDAPHDMELWGVNDSPYKYPEMSLCFFMDRGLMEKYDFSSDRGRDACEKDTGIPPSQIEDIDNVLVKICNERNLPMYSTKTFEDIPSSIAYPLQEVSNFFGVDYFGHSIDYMLALAIYQGYDVINTYGLVMSQGSKYTFEKPSTTFWIGMALGRGIEVNIYGDSSLLSTIDGTLYGYKTRQTKSIVGVKVSDVPVLAKSSETTETLSPLERILLLNIMPESGRYNLIRKVRDFKNLISFSKKEEQLLSMHHDGTGKQLKILPDAVPSKEFDISADILRAIKMSLQNMDKKGLLNAQLADLYERFVL